VCKAATTKTTFSNHSTDLERALKNADWKATDGLRGQPQSEVRVRFVQLLEEFFQLLQPMNEKMTVL